MGRMGGRIARGGVGRTAHGRLDWSWVRQVAAAGHTVVLVAERSVGRSRRRSAGKGLIGVIVGGWNEKV